MEGGVGEGCLRRMGRVGSRRAGEEVEGVGWVEEGEMR